MLSVSASSASGLTLLSVACCRAASRLVRIKNLQLLQMLLVVTEDRRQDTERVLLDVASDPLCHALRFFNDVRYCDRDVTGSPLKQVAKSGTVTMIPYVHTETNSKPKTYI